MQVSGICLDVRKDMSFPVQARVKRNSLIETKKNMMKTYFDTDYMSGAVPEILQALAETNLLHTPGYGLDEVCADAREKILSACRLPDGLVKFVVGGTQANALVIDGLLGKCQGVMAAGTAHINVHESGAIEASGHKVITLPTQEGKISAGDIDRYVTDYFRDETWPHIVEPGMVYLSFPTEVGTIYSLDELENISAVCRKHHIPLYIDGARMGYGLSSPKCDLSLPDIARLADIFYIGGTKQGALFGEAIVAADTHIIPRFMSLIKQHGALLAKGRLLGLQFKTLFTDGLYFQVSRRAVSFALQIKELMQRHGFRLFMDSYTNQQFFVLPNAVIDRLRPTISFELWGPKGEEETPVRFVTSWATTDEDIACLSQTLSEISGVEGR